ncbi:MAG: hypothetical protein ACT4RN_10605 [Pseudonocardia sp.]
MARRARTTESLVTRLGRRITKDGDGLLALLVGFGAFVLAVLDIVGDDVVGQDVLSAAILFVLALLAATLLRDRRSAKELVAQGAAVLQVDSYDADQQRFNACLSTKSWEFRGGIGDVLRAATLPAYVEANAAARLDLRAEILDPGDGALCAAYARHRALLAAGRGVAAKDTEWTAQRVREELLATIFAACWYRQQHLSLDIRIGLSSVLHTLRWEAADDVLIVSEEGKSGYALVIEESKPYYDAFTSDMTTSFRRARELPVGDTADLALPQRLRGEHVAAVFARLGLDVEDLDERGLVEIARLALAENESFRSRLRSRTVGGDEVRLR